MPVLPTYRSVLEALNNLNVTELKQLSAILPETRSYTRKAEIIAEIIPHLTGERLKSLYKSLPTIDQFAVAEVVHSDSFALDLDRFLAKYSKKPGLLERYRLVLIHLFLYDNSMPAALKQELTEFVPIPESDKIVCSDALPDGFIRIHSIYDNKIDVPPLPGNVAHGWHRDTELEAQAEVVSMLHLTHTGKLRCSAITNIPSGATEKLVAGMLPSGDWYDSIGSEAIEGLAEIDAIKAFAWPMLMQASDLVSNVSGKLTLTAKGSAAITSPPADTLRTMWKQWLMYSGYDELRRIDVIKGQLGQGKKSLTAPHKRRSTIAAGLMDCPVGRWVSIEEFWRYIRSKFTFEVSANLWTLYVSDPNYGSLAQMDDNWQLLDGRYIMCMLFEYAATLGLIDVAFVHPEGSADDYQCEYGTDDLWYFSRYDGFEYFRLNALGAYCLGKTLTYTPPAVAIRKCLRVLPNSDVVVIDPPLFASDVLLLNAYGLQTSEGVWHLGRDKVISALDQGHSIEQLSTRLTELSVDELPATVKRLFEETAERAQKLSLYGTAILFECKDPHVRTLILHDKRTRNSCYAAGDTLIAVPTQKEAAFARAIRELGYILPKS